MLILIVLEPHFDAENGLILSARTRIAVNRKTKLDHLRNPTVAAFAHPTKSNFNQSGKPLFQGTQIVLIQRSSVRLLPRDDVQVMMDGRQSQMLATIYEGSAPRPRLIIVGAGSYARYLVEFAKKKSFPIVAAYKRAGSKIGEDLGLATGMSDEVGIVIQDIQNIGSNATAQADVAMVAAAPTLKENLSTYRLLMEAGCNVLCLAPEAFDPYYFDPIIAREIDNIAKSNGVTFAGGGIWDMSRIWTGLLAMGPCIEIDELTHRSVTDIGRQVESLNDVHRYKLAIGITVEEFWAGGYDTNPTGSLYSMMISHVLRACGYHVLDTKMWIEPVISDKDFDYWVFDDPIPAGHCIGQRIKSELTTQEGVSARSEVELKLCQPNEEEYMSWRVQGIPNLTVKTIREDSINLTVSSQFNRIPDVMNAPPGISLISQMGPLKHTALIRAKAR